MTKQVALYIKENITYYSKIKTKNRYTGVKAKAWGILSDYVRMRDWIKYRTSVSSGLLIDNWKNGDAGHYISMGSNGALIGFCDMNVHLQGSNENRQSSAHTGAYFRDELVRRYGESLLAELNIIKNKTVKADDWYFIERIEYIYKLFKQLKVKYPHIQFPNYLD